MGIFLLSQYHYSVQARMTILKERKGWGGFEKSYLLFVWRWGYLYACNFNFWFLCWKSFLFIYI